MAKPHLISSADELSVELHALDTWFFRESRPHDAVGASELASLFPPPVRTLAGALRTFIGERIGIDWRTLKHTLPDFDFAASLGGSDDLGQLQLRGPWIVHQGKRLYPAPVYLMQGSQDGMPDIQRLHPGMPVRCDLGRVRLPELPAGCKGYKTLEQRWLTASGLAKCLNGQAPEINEIVEPAQLFGHEPRLGIARDNLNRKVLDGKLYQTRHLRLKDDVHIELGVKNLPPALLGNIALDRSAMLRLGGEGRMAAMNVKAPTETLPFAKAKTASTVLIHFITPADFDGKLYPESFKKAELNGQTVWQGELNGIRLIIEAAVIGKAHREGGWDMQRHQPRPVKSYIPAGSAWYCRLDHATDWQTLNQALHNQCIGAETAFGRGHILLGHWQDPFNV